MEIPKYCPYCGSENLEELQPTELLIGNNYWFIYHYGCSVCLEVFDKITLESEQYNDDYISKDN
jgi:DNA-directed RNA polymerase subunit RPC12/RpoP